MSEYDNTNSGVLFTNDKKETSKHPDLRGSINVDGVEYWMSGWFSYKKSNGEKYIQIKLNPKDSNYSKQTNSRNEPDDPFGGMGTSSTNNASLDIQDDDIPF